MLKFEKYQGAGNDFVIVSEKELIEKGIPEYGEFASQVCNRHFWNRCRWVADIEICGKYAFHVLL